MEVVTVVGTGELTEGGLKEWGTEEETSEGG